MPDRSVGMPVFVGFEALWADTAKTGVAPGEGCDSRGLRRQQEKNF
ncbi:MAG: hypothetical protein MUC60_13445 [Oscillatoria sp. Prado101]|nr:hypothetical protein [Oscillatoria sp. Prado101]